MPRYLDEEPDAQGHGLARWLRGRTLGWGGLLIAVGALGLGAYVWILSGATDRPDPKQQVRAFLRSPAGGRAPARFTRGLVVRRCDRMNDVTGSGDPITSCVIVSHQREYTACFSTERSSGRLIARGLARGVAGCDAVVYDAQLRDLRILD